jgi:hypothetical protein
MLTELRAELEESKGGAVGVRLDDSSLLPANVADKTSTDIERIFVREFARSLAGLAPGELRGTVRST